MPDTAHINRSYSILSGILVTLVTALVLLGLFVIAVRDNQQQQAGQLFARIDTIATDVYNALVPLNDLGMTDCSEENLRAMEVARFNAVYPRQIMFHVNDEGICSTGSGMLDNPARRPPPDFSSPATGAEIWVNREIILNLTGKPFVAIILKFGNYSAMLDPSAITLPDDLPFDWQILFRDPDTRHFIHALGTQGLYHADDTTRGFGVSDFFYHESCDTTRIYMCLVQSSSMASIAAGYGNVLALVGILSLVIGSYGGHLVHRHQHSQLNIATRVVNGFRNDAYCWLYQPVIDMENNRIVGCEALSRFSDAYGDALPDQYLPALRDAGLTAEFTRLMFSKILPDLHGHSDLPDDFKVSINIFPADIKSGAINDIITMPEIRNSRFNLTLEITEEEYLDEIGGQDSLDKIREAGLTISIDDFGTGYSNLKQLKKLDCSYLKIDRSYIADLEHEPIKSSLIPLIVSVAEQLDLWVIAEGVETFEQQVILVGLGIRYGQGTLFGKPMTGAELVAHIATVAIGNSGKAVILDE